MNMADDARRHLANQKRTQDAAEVTTLENLISLAGVAAPQRWTDRWQLRSRLPNLS